MSSQTAWVQMIARCYDPDHPKYPRYGGRGIRVCDRWICRRLFMQDMGPRPDGMTLNRIDNDGPYSPENCEWADHKTQQQNKHTNKNIEFNGVVKCITEWERETGIKRKTIAKRLELGWTIEQALTTPVSTSQKPTEKRHEDRYVR